MHAGTLGAWVGKNEGSATRRRVLFSPTTLRSSSAPGELYAQKRSTCNTTTIFITTTMGSVGVSLEEVFSRRDHSFLCSSEFGLPRQQRLRERVLKEG